MFSGSRWKVSVQLFNVLRASDSENGFDQTITCAKNNLWKYANYRKKLKLKQAYFISRGKMLFTRMISRHWFAVAMIMVYT